MGTKSAIKKNYIIEKAKNVFEKKGFKTVTMKDIVEECEISRGGLYLYFSNTSEIFESVMSNVYQKDFSFITDEDMLPSKKMALYLREYKKDILQKNDALGTAVFEYCSSIKKSEENYITENVKSAIDILKNIIEEGVSCGEFVCDDAECVAKDFVFVLEGLRYYSFCSEVSDHDIDKAIMHILQGIIPMQQYVN